MQLLIKLTVDSKLDRELTRQTIQNCIESWLAENGGYFPIAQDNDNEPENLIEFDNLIIT